jgi:hypothetical protein
MIIDLALHNLHAKEQKEPSPADTKVEDWEEDVDRFLHGWIMSKDLEEKYPILKAGEAIVDPKRLKNLISSLIEKVRQEEHQSVNQIYKTREEAFQEGMKMERERILAALPTEESAHGPIEKGLIRKFRVIITPPSHPSV